MMKYAGTIGKVVVPSLILGAILSSCAQSSEPQTPANSGATDTPLPPTEVPTKAPTPAPPTELPPSATPEPSAFSERMYHVSVFNSVSGKILILGGQSYHAWGMDLKDVWALDPSTGEWTQMGDVPGSMYCAAYDREADRVIGLTWELGGQTWAYDYNQDTWENMEPAESPGGLAGCRMTYDEESDRIILFGGFPGSTVSLINSKTWAYDFNANTWTLMEPATAPPKRAYHAMTYDSNSDRIVTWGGRPLSDSSDSQVWVYDYNANQWTAMPVTEDTPPIRSTYHTMTYDPDNDLILVYGGIQEDEQTLVDALWTYQYDSNTWSQVTSTTAPAPRAIHSMVYDEITKRFFVVGGEADFLYSDHVLNEMWWFDMSSGEWTAQPSP